MAKRRDTKYLERRGLKWYVVKRVPPSLKDEVGSTVIRKCLETRDLKEAQRLRWQILAELEERLELVKAKRETANLSRVCWRKGATLRASADSKRALASSRNLAANVKVSHNHW